jgi:hypothetical protein
LHRVLCKNRSADFQSAVSRIFNPLPLKNTGGFRVLSALPNAIRRYSRLKIRATPNWVSLVKKYFPANLNAKFA